MPKILSDSEYRFFRRLMTVAEKVPWLSDPDAPIPQSPRWEFLRVTSSVPEVLDSGRYAWPAVVALRDENRDRWILTKAACWAIPTHQDVALCAGILMGRRTADLDEDGKPTFAVASYPPRPLEEGTGTGTGHCVSSEIVLSQEEVRCESGELNVYVRSVTIDLEGGNLSRTLGDWTYDRTEGCCDCADVGTGTGPTDPAGTSTAAGANHGPPCCDNDVPSTLYATLSVSPVFGGCSCLNGVVVPIYYSSSLGYWIGAKAISGCNHPYVLVAMSCDSATEHWLINVNCADADGSLVPTLAANSVTCEPFEARWTANIGAADCCSSLPTGCLVTVTE